MTKQYDIEIVINGVAVMRRIIKRKAGWENEFFMAMANLRRLDSSELDAMISKGVKRK